jgi:hypothetical protein
MNQRLFTRLVSKVVRKQPEAIGRAPRLKRYRALVMVRLFSPEHVVGPDGSPAGEAVGYVRNLGVTAESESAAWRLIEPEFGEGSIFWPDCKIEEVSRSRARWLVGKGPPLDLHAFRAEAAGIWYKSGRALFEEWDK